MKLKIKNSILTTKKFPMNKNLRNLNYIRKQTYKRNDRIFRNVFDVKVLSKKILSFEINPYSKIKTILNIELACLLIFILLKTKISANAVTIAGVVWSLTGIILLSFYDSFIFYLGIIVLFLKLIPDYIDGQLAVFRKKTSITGHELDGWAGNIGTIIVMSGFYLYGIRNNPLGDHDIFYLSFLIVLFFSFADLRLHLSIFKKSYFDKNLQTHISKEKKIKSDKFIKKSSSNFVVSILKFFHFDGGSRYTDFLLILLVIERNFLGFHVFYIFPIIWSITYFLTFFKSVYLTLIK